MASPTSLKRTYAEAGLEDTLHAQAPSSPFSALTTASSIMRSPQLNTSSQLTSFGPANTMQKSLPGSSPAPTASNIIQAAGSLDGSSEQTAKKAKLTFAEKEARRVEKEFKDREKAEEKARKEAEKAKKDEDKGRKDVEKEAEKAKREEEKKLKEIEKEEKRIAKEEKARLKHEEKARREAEAEEEKMKEARKQTRLHKFFNAPSMPISSSSDSPNIDGHSPLGSRRSSIAEIKAIEDAETSRRSRSVSCTPQKPQVPNYERLFLPFPMKDHLTMAPPNRFSRDKDGRDYAEAKIDTCLKVKAEAEEDLGISTPTFDICDLLHVSPRDISRRPPPVVSVKSLVEQIHGSAQNPIDLTESQYAKVTKEPMDQLKTIPLKFLKFKEDVRPPYIGTFTRLQDGPSSSQLARNPFGRTLPQTDYDDDSEAEWEEPGEGEDLDSEGEEEFGDDEDEAEMEGFLDDEDAADARGIRRRPLLGDLEPTCTGIRWEGPTTPASKNGDFALDLLMFKLDILMDNPQIPIDPYSDAYWQSTASTTPLNAITNPQSNLMEPPRIPLNPVHRQNTLLPSPSSSVTSNHSAPMKPPKHPKRLIVPELMDEFKAEVDGNDLTKVGLLEILKKKFPKMPKDAIKETLDLVAERVGAKVSEKKWVLKPGF